MRPQLPPEVSLNTVVAPRIEVPTVLQIAAPLGTCLISDVHLSAAAPHTFNAFLKCLQQAHTNAPALVILGDLFDAWLGDDMLSAAWLMPVLTALADFGRSRPLWIGHGNRDFLLGEKFFSRSHAQFLPTYAHLTITHANTPSGYLLCHGDTLCTDDTTYQTFRETVHSPAWQTEFLSQPLGVREALAQQLRANSEQQKTRLSMAVMDANQQTMTHLLQTTGVLRLIHGHTHRPGHSQWEASGQQFERWVLPDWDYDVPESRGGGLVLRPEGPVYRSLL